MTVVVTLSNHPNHDSICLADLRRGVVIVMDVAQGDIT